MLSGRVMGVKNLRVCRLPRGSSLFSQHTVSMRVQDTRASSLLLSACHRLHESAAGLSIRGACRVNFMWVAAGEAPKSSATPRRRSAEGCL